MTMIYRPQDFHSFYHSKKKVRELLYLQGSQNNRAEGESEIPLRGEKSVEENS